MPLKIIWALLDLVTLIVLGSGVCLWLSRWKSPADARLAELQVDAEGPVSASLRSAAE